MLITDTTRRFGTLRRAPAMSNLERQRRFRERNPGYYGRLHRKRKAEAEALGAALREQAAMKQRSQLLLPAPMEQLTFFDLAQSLQRQRECEAAIVDR